MLFTFCLQPCTFTVDVDIFDSDSIARCFRKIRHARSHYEGEGFVNFNRSHQQVLLLTLAACRDASRRAYGYGHT
jgi:hypothetical protein